MIILLDTVTVSVLREPARCDEAILRWEESHRATRFCLSVVSLNEIQFGIRKVNHRDPDFARILLAWYATLISEPIDLALIEVNPTIARVAADLRYDCKMSYGDALIAATAQVHGFTLATRNVSDFEGTGIEVVNPWEFGERMKDEG